MDVLLALILSCSVHTDDHLVEALAAKLSLDNQYFVGDLSNLNTYDNAHRRRRHGGGPALGLRLLRSEGAVVSAAGTTYGQDERVDLPHVLHPIDERLIDLGHAPHFFPPGLQVMPGEDHPNCLVTYRLDDAPSTGFLSQ